MPSVRVYVDNITKDSICELTKGFTVHRLMCDCTIDGHTEKETVRMLLNPEYNMVMSRGYYLFGC